MIKITNLEIKELKRDESRFPHICDHCKDKISKDKRSNNVEEIEAYKTEQNTLTKEIVKLKEDTAKPRLEFTFKNIALEDALRKIPVAEAERKQKEKEQLDKQLTGHAAKRLRADGVEDEISETLVAYLDEMWDRQTRALSQAFEKVVNDQTTAFAAFENRFQKKYIDMANTIKKIQGDLVELIVSNTVRRPPSAPLVFEQSTKITTNMASLQPMIRSKMTFAEALSNSAILRWL